MSWLLPPLRLPAHTCKGAACCAECLHPGVGNRSVDAFRLEGRAVIRRICAGGCLLCQVPASWGGEHVSVWGFLETHASMQEPMGLIRCSRPSQQMQSNFTPLHAPILSNPMCPMQEPTSFLPALEASGFRGDRLSVWVIQASVTSLWEVQVKCAGKCGTAA